MHARQHTHLQHPRFHVYRAVRVGCEGRRRDTAALLAGSAAASSAAEARQSPAAGGFVPPSLSATFRRSVPPLRLRLGTRGRPGRPATRGAALLS